MPLYFWDSVLYHYQARVLHTAVNHIWEWIACFKEQRFTICSVYKTGFQTVAISLEFVLWRPLILFLMNFTLYLVNSAKFIPFKFSTVILGLSWRSL